MSRNNRQPNPQYIKQGGVEMSTQHIEQQAPVDQPPTDPVSLENADQQPVENAAPANVVVNTPPVVQQAVPAEKRALATATPSLMFLIQTLADYSKDLKVGVPHSPEVGAQVQSRLYGTLLRMFNNYDYEDFVQGFDHVLEWAHANRNGMAAPHQFFRYTEHLALSKVDRDTCLHIYNMISIMADPTKRDKNKGTINWNLTLGGSITEEGRNRISKFFGL